MSGSITSSVYYVIQKHPAGHHSVSQCDSKNSLKTYSSWLDAWKLIMIVLITTVLCHSEDSDMRDIRPLITQSSCSFQNVDLDL